NGMALSRLGKLRFDVAVQPSDARLQRLLADGGEKIIEEVANTCVGHKVSSRICMQATVYLGAREGGRQVAKPAVARRSLDCGHFLQVCMGGTRVYLGLGCVRQRWCGVGQVTPVQGN